MSFTDAIQMGLDAMPVPLNFYGLGYNYTAYTLGFFGLSLNDFPHKESFCWYKNIKNIQKKNKEFYKRHLEDMKRADEEKKKMVELTMRMIDEEWRNEATTG